MKNNLKIILMCATLLTTAKAAPDKSELRIGTPAPAFKLKVKSGQNGAIAFKTLNDYQGKWLILEFWSKTCSACIEGFPKLSSLQQNYNKDVQFLLVGKNDARYNLGIEKFYQKIAKEQSLKLDHSFSIDLFQTYQVAGYPHVVVIDPSGRLFSITYPQELTHTNLQRMIIGNENAFVQKLAFGRKNEAMPTQQFLDIADQSSGFPHKSSLQSWRLGDNIQIKMDLKKGLKKGQFKISGTQLGRLYMLAAFGKGLWYYGDSLYHSTWIKPILETSDTASFVFNPVRSLGQYSYQLEMADTTASLKQVQKAVQSDLSKWFGFTTTIELREMPVYVLELAKGWVSLLNNKTDNKRIFGDASGIIFTACSTHDILARINAYHPLLHMEDLSGITFPIDLELNTAMTDFEKIRAMLQKQGLQLNPSKKVMKVLIIKDKK